MKTAICVVGACLLLGAAGGVISLQAQRSKRPDGGQAQFTRSTAVTNPYLPLGKLRRQVLEGKEKGRAARVERTRLPGKRTFTVEGQKIGAIIVEDRDYAAGKLTEITKDYFAQADDGAVYYLGEDVDNYRGGKVVGHEGAWLAGVNGAPPGVMMPAHPKVGQKFQSENVRGVTQESDEVVAAGETVTTPAGVFKNCIKIKETLSEGEVEYKYYAPGVGVIKEITQGGEVSLVSR